MSFKIRKNIPASLVLVHKITCRYFSVEPYPQNLDSKSTQKLRHVDLLKDLTGCSTYDIIKVLKKYTTIQTLDEGIIRHKINLLKDMKLVDEKSLKVIPLLKFHPLSLRNRYGALREYSFSPEIISSYHICRFLSLSRSPVKILKEEELIKENCNVILNLWKAAGLSLDKCPEVSDNNTLHEIKTKAIYAYLEEKLDSSHEDKEVKKEYISRMLNKSFETINKNYYIFKDILGMSNRRIYKNGFVLYIDPDNTLQLLNRLGEVAFVDAVACLHVHPKIAAMPVENMEKSIQYMKAAGLPIEHLKNGIQVLTLNCETIRERLEEFRKNELFRYFTKYSRVFELLHYSTKFKRRLNKVHDLNLTFSYRALATLTEKIFIRYCDRGGRSRCLEIIDYLESELGIKKEDIKKKLKRHPRWTFIPIVTVGKNLQMLRNQFTDKQIIDCFYILFYQSERVQEALKQSNNFELIYKNGVIIKDYHLSLAVYLLEKESHFTGESVWDIKIDPYEDLPDLPSSTNE